MTKQGEQEIVYDGNPGYDRVEIWKEGKKFRLRIVLKDASTGDIHFYSDWYQNILEADTRAVVVARQLYLERDNLPVHVKAS